MAIPTPPADLSGGFILIKYTNGTVSHRMRFHVAPFNADATGSYVTVAGGQEASVQATATNIMNRLKPDFNTAWTMSLDAVFQNVSGTPIENFTVTAPATVAGTSASAAGPTESFRSYNFRTGGGHRMRFFRFQEAAWAYGPASTVVGADTTSIPQLVLYLSGGSPTGTPTTTQIVGHDGTRVTNSAHLTFGENKRLRRRVGNA